MQDEYENTDTMQRHFWVAMSSLAGCMGSYKGREAPWVAACDSEIHRIEESAKIKRAILAGKIKHTKLSIRRKAIKLIDLNSRKFHMELMGEVYRSPVTWDPRKAKRIAASQSK